MISEQSWSWFEADEDGGTVGVGSGDGSELGEPGSVNVAIEKFAVTLDVSLINGL